MNTTDNGIRAQLAPGWSAVNIGIMVLLFIVFFPLGLLMLGYILAGENLGLDLSRPETFSRVFYRLSGAVSAGLAEFNRQPGERPEGQGSAPDSPESPAAEYEADRLRRDREALDSERRQFEAEKRAFYENRHTQ